jgi:hypothetical protein
MVLDHVGIKNKDEDGAVRFYSAINFAENNVPVSECSIFHSCPTSVQNLQERFLSDKKGRCK